MERSHVAFIKAVNPCMSKYVLVLVVCMLTVVAELTLNHIMTCRDDGNELVHSMMGDAPDCSRHSTYAQVQNLKSLCCVVGGFGYLVGVV